MVYIFAALVYVDDLQAGIIFFRLLLFQRAVHQRAVQQRPVKTRQLKRVLKQQLYRSMERVLVARESTGIKDSKSRY